MNLDPTDRKILLALMADARLPLARLADRLGVATSTVHHRVRRLVEHGVITGSHLDVNWEVIQLPVMGLLSLALAEAISKAEAAGSLEKIPFVGSCYSISGEFDLMCMVRARSPEHLEEIIDQIRTLVPLSGSRKVVVLSTHFEGRMPPLPGG